MNDNILVALLIKLNKLCQSRQNLLFILIKILTVKSQVNKPIFLRLHNSILEVSHLLWVFIPDNCWNKISKQQITSKHTNTYKHFFNLNQLFLLIETLLVKLFKLYKKKKKFVQRLNNKSSVRNQLMFIETILYFRSRWLLFLFQKQIISLRI